MDATGIENELTEAIHDEARGWEALLAEVGEDRMEEPIGVGAWAFKDLVGHVTGWRMPAIDALEAMAAGVPAPPKPWPAGLTEVDDINAWIDEQSRQRSLEDVLNESREGYRRLAEVVGRMSEARLDDAEAFNDEDGDTLRESITSRRFFGHLHDEHEPDIRAWLARRQEAEKG